MSLFTTFAQGVSGSVDSNMVSFKGSISKGKRTGEGIMRFSCDTVYNGGHENDAFHGQATITLPNGETYEAEYKEGWLLSDCMSTYTFSDGSMLKGYPAGKTMHDRIMCLPDFLRQLRTSDSIQSEKEAAAACETYSVELDQKDEYHDYWRFRKEMETPYDKAERERVSRKNAEPGDKVAAAHIVPVPKKCVNCNVPNRCVNCCGALKSDYYLCTVCSRDFFCTVQCFNEHWRQHPCNVQEDEECKVSDSTTCVECKNAEPDDKVAAAHIVPVPKKCVNCNVPNRCVNCCGALKSDYYLCTVCSRDFFCTVQCFNQHWRQYPCNVQEDEECKVSDSTTCVECNKALTPDYFVCGICNKNYCFTKLCSDKHQASYPCSVQAYEDDDEDN
jgi:hypothetical protein